MRFEADGGRVHELNLHPKTDLGNWSGSATARATAYAGDVGGYVGSWAAVTRIGNRWSGIWYDGGDYYAIDTAGALASISDRAAKLAPEQPMVYRLRDLQWQEHSLEDDMRAVKLGGDDVIADIATAPVTMQTGQNRRRMGLTVVADAPFVQAFGDEAEALLLAQVNIIDGLFTNQVGVNIAAERVQIFTEAARSPFSNSTNTDELLSQVAAWRGSNLQQRYTGVTHLFTGRDLDGRTVGLAFVNSLCSSRFGASLSQATVGLSYTGLIAAHEIAHVFGAPHDGDAAGACAATPPDFLMAPRINGSQEFSACSLEQMMPALSAASCLSWVSAETGVRGRNFVPASGEGGGGSGGGGALPLWQLVALGSLLAARSARRQLQMRANQSAR